MPPGKITTYQEFEEEQRRKRLEAIRRQPITSLNSVEGPVRQPAAAPARPTSAIPNPQSALPQNAPAPQRGYDPRFDDPNYGLPDKARPTPLSAKPAPLPWRSPEPAVGAILNRTSAPAAAPTAPYTPPTAVGAILNRTSAATPNNRWQPFTPTPQRSLLPNDRWQPNITNIDQQPEPPPNRPMPTPLGLNAITNPPLPGASIGSTQPASSTLLSPQPAASTQPLTPQPLPPLSSNPALALYQDRARQYEQQRIRGENGPLTYAYNTAGNVLQFATYNAPFTIPLPFPIAPDSPVGRAIAAPGQKTYIPAGAMTTGQVFMPALRTLFGGLPGPTSPTQWQPTNGSLYAPLVKPDYRSAIENYVTDQWTQQYALNQAINALPPDQANAARIAVNFSASGAEAQRAGFDLIQQKQQLPQLYAQAQQLAAAGKTKEASAAYLYADSLRARSYTDLAESQSSPTAEFIANIFLDASNLLDAPIGIALDASRAARAANAIRALEAAAPASLDDALTAGQRLLGLTQAGQPALPPRNWLQQLVGRTPETQAHFAADSLLQSASQLYRNVENAADARIITEAWLNNPRSLVTGVSGLTSPGFQAGKDANGIYRFGFGAVGMPNQIKAMPILSLIKDDLLASPALADASFNPLQWLSTVDNAIYRGARQANGLVALDELPFGATRAAIANKAPQKYSIDYYDAKNNLLGSSPLMSFDAAKKYKANLDNAIQAGQKSPIMRGVRGMANIQRAMLSDMWLNLRPTHWVRNAASATAATMADDLYSLRKQADIIADLNTKFAFGAPTERIAGAIGPEAAPAAFDEQRHISRALWDKGNPLAAASEAGSKIWTGTTEIMGMPFGEQSFYLKAFDRGFHRTFRQAWSGAVDRTLTPLYETLGIAPDVGRKITDTIISSGVSGSRSDMQIAARNAVNGQYLPFDLRQLKIPDELISAEGQRQINRIINEWYASGPSPSNLTPQVETAIRTTFANERTRYTDMLRESPPQAGNYDWTKQDILDTGAEIIDQMTEAARATGGDVAAAEVAGQKLANQVADAEVTALSDFLEEIKLAPANVDAMNVAFDLLARLHKLKTATRSEIDQLARIAVDTLGEKPVRDAAWQRKFSETGRLYSQYAADVQSEIGASLNDLRTVLAGGQVERKYDWWQALNRYFNYDEEANAMQRATVLGSTGDTPRDVWEKTIEANRLFVDQSFVQVYDAFRRFPSIDSMDVLRWAHDNVDDYGARAAAYLAPLRAKAWNKELAWDKYFAIRNRVWTQVFDNQVVINDLAKRAIVSNGLSGAGAGNLRWEDPFAGSIYQLIGPGKTDQAGNVITWKAYDIQRRKIEEFANVTGAGSALPDVPQQIVEAYYRITDQLAKIKPTLDEIAQANPLPPAPARLPYETPTIRPIDRPATGFDDIPTQPYGPQPAAKPPIMRIGGRLPDAKPIAPQSFPTETPADPADLLDYAYEPPPARAAGPVTTRYPGNPAEEIDFNAIASPTVDAIPNRTPAPTTVEGVYDPTARLTKPSNWVSTQRSAPLQVGQRVTTPQGPGTVTRDANSYYGVKLDNGKTSRFKRSNVQALTTPTAQEAAQGQAIAANPPTFGQPTTPTKPTTENMFAATGEDLPLISGAPVRTPDAGPFRPAEVSATQETMFDMRPQMGDTGVTQAKPKPKPNPNAKPVRISDRIAELQSEIDDYKQTRLQYRKEWDRVAVGELGLPKLDAVNLQFNRGGFVNLSKNAGDSNDQFADLWGNTIAGIELNNTDDLQKLIDQYAGQQRRIDAATDKIAKYNRFKKLSGPEIVEQIKPQLLAEGLSEQDITELAQMPRDSVLDYYETLTEDASEIGYRYYATGMPLSPDLLRTVADDWQPIDPAEIWRNLVAYWGKGKQPEVGDVARHMVRTLNDAEDAIINSLPALAQQPPNALNQSARNAIISAVDRLGPSFDNAVAVSRNAAQNLADGAMLNYNDRRGFDQILSLVFPYHYYWTRGGLNWAKRLARKPSYINLIQEVNRFQDSRQQQLDTPQRMDSYIPLGKVGDTVMGVANPLNWILPRYTPNEFIDPEDARSQAERYWLMIQQSTPGVLPLLAYGADAFFDWQSGATNQDRKATANLRQFVPAAGIAADAYQAATGKVSPPGIGPGDPWDPYRVRTTLAVMAQEKAIDTATAQYAQQIAFNLESGKDRYAGIPPAAKTSADAAYTQAAQRSGAQRLLSTATNYLTGSALAAAPQAEIDLRKQQRDYNAAGYDPLANPYGSNALRRDILDANPALPTMWTRNATETNQPATSAQRSERWDALTNAVFDPMNQATTAAIRQNPNITPAQLNRIKAPFYERMDAIDARFPLAASSGSSRPPSGATPEERALYELKRIIESAGGTPPTWPGDNATPEQRTAYRQQKDAYDQRKLNAIERNLSQYLRTVEGDPSQPWQQELARLVQGQYATDLKRNYDDLAYAQPTEKAWAEEAYFKQAASNAQWQDKGKQVGKRLGAAAAQQWAAYHQADDATRELMRTDPAIKQALMAGYNPNEYDALIVQFGPQAWDTYFDPNYPKFPENATQDQLNAYYAQRDAYEASHPRSSELRFWLNGRYRWSDEASTPVEFYDFGKDWSEAQRVFGPDIFKIEQAANAAPDYGAWARGHQQQADLLTGYRQWKSALSDTPTSRNQLPTLNLAATPRQPQQLSSQPFRTTYTGPDPYAGMTPIGADPMPRTPTAPYIPPTPPTIPPAVGAIPNRTSATTPAYTPPTAVGAILNRTSSPTTEPWRPPVGSLPAPTAAPLDGPVTDPYTGLTAQQWAARDPKYQQRQARLDQVQQQFGAEGLQQFQEYANLPADSPQRDEYRRLHPQITLINMAAYDGANYNNLVEMFGQDALNSWANTPAWGESEAEQNIRKEYLDANPIAWLVDAYVDGRPTPYDPTAPQTERNHGADWALAEQQFGADIWQRIAAYRAADSGARRAMRDADPAIMQFYDWWYAALPDTGAGGGRPVATYRSADGLVTYDQYGRRLDSNGNVARGFYPSSSGGGGGGSSWRSYPPEVRPRYMDERLWYASDLRAWRPPDNDINMNWLNAGSRVGPDRILPWRAPN